MNWVLLALEPKTFEDRLKEEMDNARLAIDKPRSQRDLPLESRGNRVCFVSILSPLLG